MGMEIGMELEWNWNVEFIRFLQVTCDMYCQQDTPDNWQLSTHLGEGQGAGAYCRYKLVNTPPNAIMYIHSLHKTQGRLQVTHYTSKLCGAPSTCTDEALNVTIRVN